MDLQSILPCKLFEVIEKAGISTSKQIITLSVWDIKKLTNLRTDDIALLKNLVADHISPCVVTCDTLIVEKNQLNISTGCEEIDEILRGGFRIGTITEVYGESGSGKTQLALQTAACNWARGTLFLCTEGQFPVKRLEQINTSIAQYNHSEDYWKNTFVEHITEANDLLACIRVRLPNLLEKHNLSLIVVDSVAGPFRSEYTNYVQRAEDLRELAIELISLAQQHNLAVLCLNQVTAVFDGVNNVSPTLGLAWSNMISTRLWLRKRKDFINLRTLQSVASAEAPNIDERDVPIRELSVVFASDLPNSSVKFIITPTGIRSIKKSQGFPVFLKILRKRCYKMSCNTCAKPFTLLRKEKGCPSCGFSYCSKCLNNKLFLPKLNSEAKVCTKCSKSSQSRETKLVEPPDAYYKRLGLIKGPSVDKTDSPSTGEISNTDAEIAARLKKLKEGMDKPVAPEEEIAQRLQKIKGEMPRTTDNELQERLAKLRGVPTTTLQSQPVLIKPDLRTEQEQADDLMKQYLEQANIDTKYKDEFDYLVSNMETRLGKLKDQTEHGGTSAFQSKPVEESESDEETAVKKVLEKVIAEGAHDDDELPPSTEDELPFCEICNEDAKMRCLGCRYLFCNRCFIDHKDADDGCDRYEPYKTPKNISH